MKKYEAPTLWTMKLLKEDVLAQASVSGMGTYVGGADGILGNASDVF